MKLSEPTKIRVPLTPSDAECGASGPVCWSVEDTALQFEWKITRIDDITDVLDMSVVLKDGFVTFQVKISAGKMYIIFKVHCLYFINWHLAKYKICFVEGALWLATQSLKIRCYSPSRNSREICVRKIVIVARINELKSSFFCSIISLF